MDLIIEGDPAELEWLRREIDRELGAEAQLEAVPSQPDDEFSEPLIIALIIALGGKTITTSVSAVLQRRYQHKEEMERLAVQLRESEMKHEVELTELRLRLTDGDGDSRQISERDLAELEV